MKTYIFFKRLLDIIFSFLLFLLINLILLFPFLTIACWISSKTSPFFIQIRVGKNGKTFKIIKFRTMIKTAPPYIPSEKLDNPFNYYTSFGRWLRVSHLDELPQLLNIFIGNMSFVGPRPSLVCQTELNEYRKLNNINALRPGLTGYAQVNANHVLSDLEKIEYESKYLSSFSFKTDFKIVIKTFLMFIKRR